MNQIVSLSGGKDSTAMLLMMLERKEPIHSVVFFDTGWEFPEMLVHIEKLKAFVWEKYQLKVWTIHPRLPFEYWMFGRPITAKKGPEKGKVHRIGNGWPSSYRRWCTSKKVEAIQFFTKPIPDAVSCIGYAKDEEDRQFHDAKIQHRFPLIEYGVTEKDALRYCFDKGYNWGGLYDVFHRVSCFCCPLQKLSELRKLRRSYPQLWTKMLEWDDMQPSHNQGFLDQKSVHNLENRFAEEDRQLKLFN